MSCFLAVDCTELDASLSTSHTFGSSRPRANHSQLTQGAAGSGPQNVRFPGDGIYRRHGLPEPADNEAKDRFQSVCERIPGLVTVDRF